MPLSWSLLITNSSVLKSDWGYTEPTGTCPWEIFLLKGPGQKTELGNTLYLKIRGNKARECIQPEHWIWVNIVTGKMNLSIRSKRQNKPYMEKQVLTESSRRTINPSNAVGREGSEGGAQVVQKDVCETWEDIKDWKACKRPDTWILGRRLLIL